MKNLEYYKEEYPYVFSGKLIRVVDIPESDYVLALSFNAETSDIIYSLIAYRDIPNLDVNQFIERANCGSNVSQGNDFYKVALEEFATKEASWLLDMGEDCREEYRRMQDHIVLVNEKIDSLTDIVLTKMDLRKSIEVFLKKFAREHQDLSADQLAKMCQLHATAIAGKALKAP